MIQSEAVLAGKRVLLIEDEAIVAMLIEEMLLDFDCHVAARASTLGQALAAARDGDFDVAVLDVNLGGQQSYPVADVLAARRIPFVYLSGYGAGALRPNEPAWRICRKPFTAAALTDALMATFAAQAA
jgi:CheY-like chemotaxis protein